MNESMSALYLRDPRSAMALRRQMFAQALAGKGMSDEPIRAHSQGLNRLAQSAMAAMLMYRGDKEAEESAAKREEQSSQFQSMLASILGGQPMQSQPPMPAPPGPQPAMAPAQPGLPMPAADFSARIHRNESGGRMTPGIIGDGGRAAGPMQVHQGAIDEVNKRLGTSYTLEQAASNPQVGKLIGDAYAEMMRGQFSQNDPQAMAAFNAGPGRVGRAVAQGGDQWMQAIPASTQGYVQRGMGGQPAAAPAPEHPQNPFEGEIEKARKLQAAAVAAANHPDPAIRSQAPMLMQQAAAIEQRATAGMARAEAQANRIPQTVTMKDPDGKAVGIYEMTPQGPGRRLGNAPRQPGESGGPFAGTGMDQQAANTLLGIGPKIQAGTATDSERAQYALAYEHVASGKVSTIPDPTDPTGQRTMLGRVPGVVPPNFPPPNGAQPGMAPGGGGAQPMPAPGMPAAAGMPTPIPGTTRPPPPLTETQGRVGTFADRIANSIPVIEKMTGAGLSAVQQGMASVPLVGNYMISNDMQQLDQARRDFINAVLRRESGAVISLEEFDNAKKQYFPIPGDKPDVLAQKKKNRETVLEGFAREAGPQYKLPNTASGGGKLRFNPETGKIE